MTLYQQQEERMKKAKIKEISNIEELKDYILNNELTQKQIEEILRATLNIWVSGDYTDKKEFVKAIEEFYNKHPNEQDRPFFLDVEKGNIRIQDFGYR